MKTRRPQDLAKWECRNIEMYIGWWKDLMPDESMKIVIAKALNACIEYNNMQLKGYLITKRRVFLLLDNEEDQMICLGNAFFYSVDSIVSKYFKERDEEFKWNEYKFQYPNYLKRLFRSKCLTNRFVIEIIGKPSLEKEKRKFVDPNYLRLKKIITNYNYCSAIDYSGAIGPVDFFNPSDFEN